MTSEIGIPSCQACGRSFAKADPEASISGSIMGDEVSDVYYFCPDCRAYTVAHWWESFCGPETVSFSGPVSEAEGRQIIAAIRTCAAPWDKRCRCPAHLAHFRGQLD